MIVAQPALHAARQLGWWALGRRHRFRITGPSMEPTLRSGEFVLVDPARTPGPGELALARHPGQPEITVVKRVGAIDPDGRYVLASDNPAAGTDSRQWGPVAADAILGRVELVLDRPAAPLRPHPAAGSGAGAAASSRPSVARWLRR